MTSILKIFKKFNEKNNINTETFNHIFGIEAIEIETKISSFSGFIKKIRLFVQEIKGKKFDFYSEKLKNESTKEQNDRVKEY